MVNERLDTYPIIHDPLNYLNVAKNSYRINEVREIFSNAYDFLQNRKIANWDYLCENKNNLIYELLL